MPFRLARSLVFEITGLFVLGVAAVALLLSIDLLTVLARFLIEQDAEPVQIARLLAAKVPWFLHLGLPVAATFAVLVAGGRMARDSELKAMQAGGVAPSRLLLPLLAWGALVSLAAVAVNGSWEPRAERTYQRIIDTFLYARPPAATERDASFVVEGTIFHAARIRADLDRPGQARLDGIVIRRADGTVRTAHSGRWIPDPGRWELESGWSHARDADPVQVGPETIAFPLALDPDATLARADQLTLGELSTRIAERRAAGADASELRFDLHRRLADAASAFVFVLAAGSLALRLRGRAAGVAWTIALVAAFWALWTFTAALFDRGVLGPAVAAWATPALVAVIGLLQVARGDRA
ncbi:MAG: LptF/LptG family permease [Trueperaceae bacterium]